MATRKREKTMVRFSDMPPDNPDNMEYKALQCWPILTSLAHDRKTITYGELAGVIGYGKNQPGKNGQPRRTGANQVLGWVLGRIYHFCLQNGLPELSNLVVGAKSGIPGYAGRTHNDSPAEQIKVYKVKWYDIMQPTVSQLGEAFDFGYRGARAAGDCWRRWASVPLSRPTFAKFDGEDRSETIAEEGKAG